MTKISFQTYQQEARNLLTLGYPIIISQLGIIAMGVADTIQVGRIEGKGAVSVSASGFVNSLGFTVAIIPLITLGIIAPMISKAKAENDTPQIRQLFKAGKRVSWYLSATTVIICLTMGFFFDKLGQEPEVAAEAFYYNILMSISMIPLLYFVALRQLSDGLGRTKMAMVITISAVFINVLFNWLLINGIGIFPRLELIGSGIATSIGRLYMATALWFLIHKEAIFKPYTDRTKEGINYLVKKILSIGLPSGLQGFFEVGVFSAAVVIIGWYGKYQQAAHMIAISLCSVTYMMVTGVASAGGIRVGHFWGLKDKQQMMVAGKTALSLGGSFMALCGLIFFAFPQFLISLYTTDAQVVPIASVLLLLGGVFQISDGLQATALGILRGISDVNFPTLITLFAYWIVGLPIGYVLGDVYGMKAAGVWIGLTAGLTASAILLCWRFFQRVKKIG
ncbi:MAG: MATE family efflux transporter [Saprospiraceae bacterium]|nr:MATE family efflux transporter [Saprospiraceae bacterium]